MAIANLYRNALDALILISSYSRRATPLRSGLFCELKHSDISIPCSIDYIQILKKIPLLLTTGLLILQSCGDLKGCGYIEGQDHFRNLDGNIMGGLSFLAEKNHDSNQQDSVLFQHEADSTASLKWKSRCQYVILQKAPLQMNHWIVARYESNWSWSGMDCKTLPFVEAQTVEVDIQEDSMEVSWAGDPCADTSSETDTDTDTYIDWD